MFDRSSKTKTCISDQGASLTCELAPHFFRVAHVLGVVWYVLSDVLLFVLVLWFRILIRPVRSSGATLGLVVPSGEGSRELAEELRAIGNSESCLE
jgi:hypothetical protein